MSQSHIAHKHKESEAPCTSYNPFAHNHSNLAQAFPCTYMCMSQKSHCTKTQRVRTQLAPKLDTTHKEAETPCTQTQALARILPEILAQILAQILPEILAQILARILPEILAQIRQHTNDLWVKLLNQILPQ